MQCIRSRAVSTPDQICADVGYPAISIREIIQSCNRIPSLRGVSFGGEHVKQTSSAPTRLAGAEDSNSLERKMMHSLLAPFVVAKPRFRWIAQAPQAPLPKWARVASCIHPAVCDLLWTATARPRRSHPPARLAHHLLRFVAARRERPVAKFRWSGSWCAAQRMRRRVDGSPNLATVWQPSTWHHW